MKVKYIQCMDFVFSNVEVPAYETIEDLCAAISNSEVIKLVATDGNIDYVNSNYIMYLGV